MREGTRNFLVGLTAIVALLGLGALMMLFGELDAILKPSYRVTIFINNAGGLYGGSMVEFNGVPVGNVRAVTLRDHPERPVVVVADVRQPTLIPSDATVSIARELIGTAARLQFIAHATSDGKPVAPLPTDGSAQMDAVHRDVLSALGEQLDERMKPIVAALDSFRTLSDTYNRLGQEITGMLEEQSADALAGGEPANLRTAVTKLNGAIDDTRAALKLASEWLSDEQMRSDVRNAISQAQMLITKATDAVERFGGLADSLQADANTLVSRIVPVADELSLTLERVRAVMTKADKGDGTLGQLLNNPDLYRSLDDAAKRLDQALIEARLLIQKFQAEGVPVKF